MKLILVFPNVYLQPCVPLHSAQPAGVPGIDCRILTRCSLSETHRRLALSWSTAAQSKWNSLWQVQGQGKLMLWYKTYIPVIFNTYIPCIYHVYQINCIYRKIGQHIHGICFIYDIYILCTQTKRGNIACRSRTQYIACWTNCFLQMLGWYWRWHCARMTSCSDPWDCMYVEHIISAIVHRYTQVLQQPDLCEVPLLWIELSYNVYTLYISRIYIVYMN